MSSVSFSSEMRATGRNTGIEVPPEIVERLGGGRRAAVVVRVNGYEYRSTIGAMGGRSLIPFSADRRQATGIAGGDPIEVVLTLDEAPREAPVPTDLAVALEVAGARAAFDALAPSRRRAHIDGVEGAKSPPTRERRIAAVVAGLVG